VTEICLLNNSCSLGGLSFPINSTSLRLEDEGSYSSDVGFSTDPDEFLTTAGVRLLYLYSSKNLCSSSSICF
jgi:hypothetical protein